LIDNSVQVDGEAWARRLALFLLVCIGVVGLLDFFFYFLEWFPSEIISRSFDISRESSLGTWLSTSLALFTGLIAGGVFAVSRRQRESMARTAGWAFVALFFLYVSFDDAAKFHERVGTAFEVKYEQWTNSELISWFPSWGWQLFVAPFFVLAGTYMTWFFYVVLPMRLKVWVFIGFSLYGLAVGADFVEAMLLDESFELVHLLRLAEELIEMIGTTVFLYTFAVVLNSKVSVRIGIRDEASK